MVHKRTFTIVTLFCEEFLRISFIIWGLIGARAPDLSGYFFCPSITIVFWFKTWKSHSSPLLVGSSYVPCIHWLKMMFNKAIHGGFGVIPCLPFKRLRKEYCLWNSKEMQTSWGMKRFLTSATTPSVNWGFDYPDLIFRNRFEVV